MAYPELQMFTYQHNHFADCLRAVFPNESHYLLLSV